MKTINKFIILKRELGSPLVNLMSSHIFALRIDSTEKHCLLILVCLHASPSIFVESQKKPLLKQCKLTYPHIVFLSLKVYAVCSKLGTISVLHQVFFQYIVSLLT